MPNYLKEVSFEFEEEDGFYPHIAYTTPSVGGAASGLNKPILLKSDHVKMTPESVELMKASKEIRIEMSFEEFLSKFMGMYWEDATVLAKLLGFESSLDESKEESVSYKDYLEEKVESFTVLKSLEKSKDKDFFSLELKDQKNILSLQERFEEGLRNEAITKGLSEGTDPKLVTDNKTVGDKMTDTVTDYADLKKSVESLQEALNLEKSKREALEAKEEARIEKAFIEKAKEFSSFVEDAEAFGKLMKGLDEEVAVAVFSALEKAQEAVKEGNQDMFSQQSVSGESEDLDALAKKKSATKSALKKQLKIQDEE